jgi:hypothetical protein
MIEVFCLFYSLPFYIIVNQLKTKLMEQIRFYGETRCPNLFDPTDQEEPPMKIGTEVFDCTMPSELEFDDESSNHQV